LNLLFTQTAYPPSIGGAQIHLHQLCQKLSEQHTVKIASFWATNRTDWLLGTTWFAPGEMEYETDNIPVRLIHFSLREKILMSPWVLGYYFWQSASIHKIAQVILPQLRSIGENADLVHHGRVGREPLAYASLALASEKNIPFVLTPYHHPRWSSRSYRNYHYLYRQADAVVALTSAEAQTLEDLGVKRERIFIVGTGGVLSDTYDPTGFRKKYCITNEPLVLFIGQKYAYKGFTHLLKAASYVWAELPEVQFLFVGPRTRFSRRVFWFVRDSRIIELGRINAVEKTSALAACDVFCLPSRQESFGGVFLEAWGMSKPVIGADIPAVHEVIDNGKDGFICPPDPAVLAEHILILLNNQVLRMKMGAAGYLKAVRDYNWSVLAERTEAIYSQILGKA